jgi:DNA-binding MarR family transcriptional regulator
MDSTDDWPPVPIGALFRFGLHEIRSRIFEGVRDAGFDDVRPAHVTLFRWPGPDGRRPTAIATDVQLSKQRVNDLLRELEALGYLDLQPDPSDNRARTVRLSLRGRSLHEIALAKHAQVEDEWAKVVGEARYQSARATLAELVANLPGALLRA